MYLSQPTDEHLIKLMSWFPTENELNLWSGPNFRFPFELAAFKRDLTLDTLASFSLLSAKSELLGFGQYYLRLDKCHLGRLVINPRFRGQGIAGHLIQQLCRKGKAELSTHVCSLFVMEHNESAIKTYQKLGFIFQPYPEEISLKNCLYMVSG